MRTHGMLGINIFLQYKINSQKHFIKPVGSITVQNPYDCLNFHFVQHYVTP